MNIRRFGIFFCIAVIMLLMVLVIFVVHQAISSAPEPVSSSKETNGNTNNWFTPQLAIHACVALLQLTVVLITVIAFLWKVPSREDLKLLKTDIENNIASLKSDIEGDITSLKSDTEGDIKTLKSDSEGDIKTLKSDIEDDIGVIRGHLDESRQEHSDHVKYHLSVLQDSAASQRGGSIDDDHRERTRPSPPQGDRSETQ